MRYERRIHYSIVVESCEPRSDGVVGEEVCASREEMLKHPHRYIIGDVKDVERYTPPEIKEEYVVARYGAPYVAYLAVGFSLYVLLSLEV